MDSGNAHEHGDQFRCIVARLRTGSFWQLHDRTAIEACDEPAASTVESSMTKRSAALLIRVPDTEAVREPSVIRRIHRRLGVRQIRRWRSETIPPKIREGFTVHTFRRHPGPRRATHIEATPATLLNAERGAPRSAAQAILEGVQKYEHIPVPILAIYAPSRATPIRCSSARMSWRSWSEPLRLTRPAVGLRPTAEFQVAGRRIDA